MPKLREPPFADPPNASNRFWSPSWFEWLRDVWYRVNRTIGWGTTAATPGNFLTSNSNGDLVDSGKEIPDGDVVGTTDEQYLTNKKYPDPTNELNAVNLRYANSNYLREMLLPEAGTEDGTRAGSFRIGIFTDDDFAFFDELGNLIFYGNTGLKITNPLIDSGLYGKIAVFDSYGNIKYKTLSELIEELNEIYTNFTTISENFLVDVPLPEAGTHGLPYTNTLSMITQIQAGGGGGLGFQYKTRTIEIRDGWIDDLGTESDWVNL